MSSSPIDLGGKQSKAWHYLEDNETTEVFYGGAAGGGKSYLGCVWQIIRRVKYPGTRGMIGRAKLKALKDSTLVTFLNVAKSMGYVQGIHFKYNASSHIIYWVNESTTLLKDLAYYPSDPDFISLGSTEFTDAFIDEAPEITLRAFEIVSSRMRYKLHDFGLVPKVMLTGNPSPGWCKDRYVKTVDNEPVILKPHQKFVQALVTDNPDEEFQKIYAGQLEKLTSEYDKQRLLYGDWDVEREVANAFATHYDPEKHEANVKHDPKKQLVISIDFNLNPFGAIFAHIWRDNEGDHCHIFDEVTIVDGSIPEVIDEIKKRFQPQLFNCVITGDSMGKNRDIGRRDHASHYKQLEKGLGLRSSQIKVPNVPTHQNSREDCNYILYHFPDFKINPVKAPNTARDFKVVQCDAFGTIIKGNRRDITQRADHLDCTRYLINTFLFKWISRHQKRSTGRVNLEEAKQNSLAKSAIDRL
jgi:hypothetical protein